MIITSLNSSNELRAAVRALVKLAVLEGLLVKTSCACGIAKTKGHHDDYSKPFDVAWLCEKCHSKRHRALGWGYKGYSVHHDAPHERVSKKSVDAARQLIFSNPATLLGFTIRSVSHLRGKGVKLPKEFVLKS